MGVGVDLAFEAVGRNETVAGAIDCTRKGGTVTLIGNIQPEVTLPLQKVVTRQIRLQGSCASSGEYPQAIELIASGKIKVGPLITAVAPLEEGPRWFERLHCARTESDESDSDAEGSNERRTFRSDRPGCDCDRHQPRAGTVSRARAGAGPAPTWCLPAASAMTLAAFEAEIKALGRRAVSLELDVRDQESIERMAADAEAAFGQIHILVNNAGCNIRKPALEVTWDDWNQILDTNLRGTFFVAQAVARRMIAKGYGRIVNIGSVTSVFGYAGLAPYGASRGGVRQLTMSLADDWGKYGVTVNCLAPGWFRTEQNKVLYENQEWVDYLIDRIPVKRPGEPHDLDGAVVFLASEASRYVTGQTLLVDGGISIGSTRATVAPAKQT